ncbi:hypothetical protein D3C81_1100060 [compost metagenome]
MVESKSFNKSKLTNKELLESIESRVSKAKILYESQKEKYGITDLDLIRNDIINIINEGVAKVTNIVSKRIKNPFGVGEVDIVDKGTFIIHKCFESMDIAEITEMNIDDLLLLLSYKLLDNNKDSYIVGEFGRNDIALFSYKLCSNSIMCDIEGKFCKTYLKAELKNDKPIGTIFLILEDK